MEEWQKLDFNKIHPYLPIFCIKSGSRGILYTHGYLSCVSSISLVERLQQGWEKRGEHRNHPLATQLEVCARETVHQWEKTKNAPFAPECLTVYLSNRCNLACRYCYAGVESRDSPVIDETCVVLAAQFVAQNCALKKKPFYFVLHGGGEPTLHWALVEKLYTITRKIANQFGIDWFGYIATHGVLSEAKAKWLAEHFSLIGLSCDGPPEIQDRQRPLVGDQVSSTFIERTAKIFRECGAQFETRTTITPESMEYQTEIVEYLFHSLGARKMRFEPMYFVSGMKSSLRFMPQQADQFVFHFLKAQKKALSLGCELTLSGVRLHELHGPYCDISREVLHLTPDGKAVSCFFCTNGSSSKVQNKVIGWIKNEKTFFVDRERIAELKSRAFQIPDDCNGCINSYHCSRGCPEICIQEDPENTDRHQNFRCMVYQKLAKAWIIQLVDTFQHNFIIHKKEREEIDCFLSEAPSCINREAILEQWKKVTKFFKIQKRELPSPIWVHRGFEHDGFQAWKILSEEVLAQGKNTPISIYIHVPFCDRRCFFCDCYSLPMGTKNRELEIKFEKALLEEIRFWSEIPFFKNRTVTTVHFGGGTPNYLSPHIFKKIIDTCWNHFGITEKTEWALESTSSLLTPEHLEQLWSWGFRRLHVGVQTLEDPVRKLIGRRESSEKVIEKLRHALKMGFIVSVDIIYGLPSQTLQGLVDTLKILVSIGIHGFSLYSLQVSQRNQKFLERHNAIQRNWLYDYVLFQVAEQFLEAHQYQKNHFTHFAKPEDKNLYYTYPQRNEDLLALGPIADGEFEFYHYRHPELKNYLEPQQKMPILQGGLWESPLEQNAKPFLNEIMSGAILSSIFHECGVLDNWIEAGLVRWFGDERKYYLTANGSWFVTTMLNQLMRKIKRRVKQ